MSTGVHGAFYMGGRDPHSHPHACVERPLSFKPFPLPQYMDSLWKPYLLLFYVRLQMYITL